MSNNQTITLPQGEFAAYQTAIESAKDRIAELQKELRAAQERERIASETYNGQQQSYRELETLYQAAQGRALEAEAEVTALRNLDQLDRALEAMTISEVNSARARIDTALVPQLANMLALCLVKEDGELYNVVSWALGATEPFGSMELLLQRVGGKSPTQLCIEAEADAQALKLALQGRQTCENCGGRGITWTDVDGEAEAEACECWIFAHEALSHPHPGAVLLAELEALRSTALAYVTSATYDERERLRSELYALAMKGSE